MRRLSYKANDFDDLINKMQSFIYNLTFSTRIFLKKRKKNISNYIDEITLICYNMVKEKYFAYALHLGGTYDDKTRGGNS